ncbi:MAG: D-glycero-beta-D-manno-heptose-7-phosphate kinase [Victivallales bacterium]|nr:D-glycero-beta-D-manno-heptose-7-phosphate kinase [Victivallales bacterium]
MKKARLTGIVDKFRGKRIAVIGDLMLDVYIWGKASRISPEAPVPIVQVKSNSYCLGGAANVMRNIVTLGGKVNAYGVIGNDTDGERMKELFREYDIDSGSLAVDKSRRTTKKQRIIASAQQLLRVDFEDTEKLDDLIREQLVSEVEKLIDTAAIDALVFEDYGKGVLSETMLERLVFRAREKSIITSLDPKPGHLPQVKGLTVMKPNRSEAFAMTGQFQHSNGIPVEADTELHAVAARLLSDWEPEYLLISLAAQGMALFRKDTEMVFIPTKAREVYDVSGAGDTVIAAFTLALCAGADPAEAAEIANHAAGIVVGKVGTVTVSREELLASFEQEL